MLLVRGREAETASCTSSGSDRTAAVEDAAMAEIVVCVRDVRQVQGPRGLGGDRDDRAALRSSANSTLPASSGRYLPRDSSSRAGGPLISQAGRFPSRRMQAPIHKRYRSSKDAIVRTRMNRTAKGLILSKYRGTDRRHRDESEARRRAMQERRLLVYLYGLAPGWYWPERPAYVVNYDPGTLGSSMKVERRGGGSPKRAWGPKDYYYWFWGVPATGDRVSAPTSQTTASSTAVPRTNSIAGTPLRRAAWEDWEPVARA